MAGKEEEGSMEAEKWTLTPCTAPKSMEGSAAGGEGSHKSKAAVAAEREQAPPEGVCTAKAADEPGSLDPFGSQRRASAIDKMLPVPADDEHYLNREELVALAAQVDWKKTFSRCQIATEEEELEARKDGSYQPYVPDEDDDLLDDLSSDDEYLIFRGFGGDDDAHKVAAVSD